MKTFIFYPNKNFVLVEPVVDEEQGENTSFVYEKESNHSYVVSGKVVSMHYSACSEEYRVGDTVIYDDSMSVEFPQNESLRLVSHNAIYGWFKEDLSGE